MTTLQPHASDPSAVSAPDSAPGSATDGDAPAWVRVIGPAMPFVAVAGMVISVLAAHASRGGSWLDATWDNAVPWLVGAWGFMGATPHILMPGPVARSIGWAPSPFQWELGFASLGMAIAGVMAGGQPRAFSLAVIIAFTTFMWGAAVGHVREMVKQHNFASGNAGPIFFYDVLAPAFLIWLYLATS